MFKMLLFSILSRNTAIERFRFLQDYNIAKIRFHQENIQQSYSLQQNVPDGSDEYVVLCGQTNSLVSALDSSRPISVYVALNGQDYVLCRHIPMVSTKPKTAIVIYEAGTLIFYYTTLSIQSKNLISLYYIGNFEFNSWSLSHNIGILSVTSRYSTSLTTFYVLYSASTATSSQQISDISQTIRSYQSNSTVDVVFFVAAVTGPAVLRLAEIFESTNFLVCAPMYPEYAQYVRNNVDYYWAELYQSWFLSGYLAGLMLGPTGTGTICYIQPIHDTYNRLLLNAFAYGALKASPSKNVSIPVWVSNTYSNRYELQQLATKILETTICDQMATNAFTYEAARIFANRQQGTFVR